MAEKKPAETAADRVPFETLIKGEYKEDFQKKVEEILRKRFRNQEKRREEPAKNEEKPAENCEKPEEIEKKPEKPGENPEPAAPEPEERAAGEQAASEDRDPRYERLLRSARAARRTYPQLDLRRELASPRFADMVLRGVDVKTAYEAVHHEEMLRSAMGYGVQKAAEKLSRARITGRPAENGAESQSASVERLDPRHMTAEERADIRRRVLERGEKVWF